MSPGPEARKARHRIPNRDLYRPPSPCGLAETPANLAQAETIYLRAMATALREQADAWGNGFIDDADRLHEAATAAVCEQRMPANALSLSPGYVSAPAAAIRPAALVSLSALGENSYPKR